MDIPSIEERNGKDWFVTIPMAIITTKDVLITVCLEETPILTAFINFIDEDKWIIVTKELGEYNKENRDTIKAEKMKEKLNKYNYEILLDDDHKILKETQKILGNNASVFHISAAII